MFTKKHGIYAARLMLRLRLAFTNRTYYTMTLQSGLNKTAPAAVLHGSMFSKPCAPAQGRVQRTRAAAQTAALRLWLYHISKLTLRAPLVFTKKHGIYTAKFILRLRLAFAKRTYYTINMAAAKEFYRRKARPKVITIIGSRTSVSYCLNFLKKGERQNEDFGTQVRGF